MNKADAHVPEGMTERLIKEAKMLEAAGASMLDFTNSGPIVGPKVVEKAPFLLLEFWRWPLAGWTCSHGQCGYWLQCQIIGQRGGKLRQRFQNHLLGSD